MKKIKIKLIKLSVGYSLSNLETDEQYFIAPSDTTLAAMELALDAYYLGHARALNKSFGGLDHTYVFYNESGWPI